MHTRTSAARDDAPNDDLVVRFQTGGQQPITHPRTKIFWNTEHRLDDGFVTAGARDVARGSTAAKQRDRVDDHERRLAAIEQRLGH